MGLKGQVRVFAWSMWHKGIFLIMFASKLSKLASKTSSFHVLCSWSMRALTLALAKAPIQGDTIFGECFTRSQHSPQIVVDRPSPILQTAPPCMTSLPLIMLFHTCEGELRFVASMIVQFGKNLALKTLKTVRFYCVKGAKFVLQGGHRWTLKDLWNPFHLVLSVCIDLPT